MTDKEILEMPFGKEFNMSVAEKVMGWKWVAERTIWWEGIGPVDKWSRYLVNHIKVDSMLDYGSCGSDSKSWIRKANGDEPLREFPLCGVPDYNDSAKDYDVLQEVQSKWTPGEFFNFIAELHDDILKERDTSENGVVGLFLLEYYKPGDYARAALLTISKKESNVSR